MNQLDIGFYMKGDSMTMLALHDKAPNFTLTSAQGEAISLQQFRGKKVVLFFYPKNMTSACTQEACDFRDNYERLQDLNVEIIGISTDPVKSHLNFVTKKELPYYSLSDEHHEVCEAYGVWQLKKLYGREYMGIVRTTFLIDEAGHITYIWPKVKVKGHVEQVYETIKQLEG